MAYGYKTKQFARSQVSPMSKIETLCYFSFPLCTSYEAIEDLYKFINILPIYPNLSLNVEAMN